MMANFKFNSSATVHCKRHIWDETFMNNNPDMTNEYRRLTNQVGHMKDQSNTDYLNDISPL